MHVTIFIRYSDAVDDTALRLDRYHYSIGCDSNGEIRAELIDENVDSMIDRDRRIVSAQPNKPFQHCGDCPRDLAYFALGFRHDYFFSLIRLRSNTLDDSEHDQYCAS